MYIGFRVYIIRGLGCIYIYIYIYIGFRVLYRTWSPAKAAAQTAASVQGMGVEFLVFM